VNRTVEALECGVSEVSAIVEGAPNGLFRLFGPLMAWMVKRSVDKDYAKLREVLER